MHLHGHSFRVHGRCRSVVQRATPCWSRRCWATCRSPSTLTTQAAGVPLPESVSYDNRIPLSGHSSVGAAKGDPRRSEGNSSPTI
ncbi:MAG: hypothetical protein ACYCZB_02725 [Acidiphilium sp.]